MQAAVPAGEGAMTAVSGRAVASHDFRAALDALEVDVANFNSPDQIVLSGPAAAMERACACATELAADTTLEFTPLVVSAPFHSRRMRSIEAPFRAALDEAAPRIVPERALAVTSNVRGGFHTGEMGALLDALERQISGSVDWIGNMRTLAAVSDRIIEVGPNRPLRRFFQSVGVEISSIVSVKTAERGFST
jgi:[acyl-carrier-protein] S-malonyltransferase/trans-AT polyketide synthase/acyltransferase/oxidoreductase domain-containing protein